MTKRKFYKTVISIEVLSEDEFVSDNMSLQDIAYAVTEGDCSGRWETKSVKILNGKQAAKALLKQGTDPEFFWLTKDGEEIDPFE